MVMILWALLACGGESAEAEPAPATEEGPRGQRTDIDVAGLEKALADGATLIDVRTPDEYAAGHVDGAVNIPLGFSKKDPGIAALDKGQPVYLICASGNRSARAADQLAGYGYHTVNVQGGTRGWMASGRQVVK